MITNPATLADWRRYEMANRRANRAYREEHVDGAGCRFDCGFRSTYWFGLKMHERYCKAAS